MYILIINFKADITPDEYEEIAVKDAPTSGGLKNYRTARIGRGLHQLGFFDLSNSAGTFLESEMVPKHHGILEDSEFSNMTLHSVKPI